MTAALEIIRHNYDTKQTAALIRADLKAAYPTVKFSLRIARGTAYGYMDATWTDGPYAPAVDAICNGYRSERFDGMDDSHHVIPPTMYANPDGTYTEHRYSCRGVLTRRDISPEAQAWAESVAVRGSQWWPIGVDWEEYIRDDNARVRHAARQLLDGINLTDGFPADPNTAFVERWQR